jgi:PAS domain S-box-containing protein
VAPSRVGEIEEIRAAFLEATRALSERTRALRDSETRYRQLFDRSPAGIVLTTAGGRVVQCNDAFARILGYASRDAVLAANAQRFYADPGDRDRLLARLAADETAGNVELGFVRLDGRRIHVLMHVARVAGLAPAEFQAALIDISDHKQAEALRNVALLANAAAHEINNPLTVLAGDLELLRRETDGVPAVERRIARMRGALERIRAIVAGMGRITRLEIAERSSQAVPEMLDIQKSSAGAAPDRGDV